jgi:hypothetical protein
MIASSVVVSEHVEPTAGSAVAEHDVATGKGMSIIVAGTLPPPGPIELCLSVTRKRWLIETSPV